MASDGLGNRNATDTRLLDDLIADTRAEWIWETIRRHAPDLAPADLIKLVLRTRRSAAGSVARKIEFFDLRFAEYVSRVKAQQKKLRDLLRAPAASLDPLALAAALERLAQEHERAALEAGWAADSIRTLHQQHLGAPGQVAVPRQGTKSHRARTAFIELLGEFFRRHTGREALGTELLGAIAELAAIAIRGAEPEEDDPESIARRQRRRPKS